MLDTSRGSYDEWTDPAFGLGAVADDVPDGDDAQRVPGHQDAVVGLRAQRQDRHVGAVRGVEIT